MPVEDRPDPATTVRLLALLSLIAAVGTVIHAEGPSLVQPYQEVIDRTLSLNDFIKDPENWTAEDKFAAWYVRQKKLKTDPKAKLEPWDFYADRFSFSIRKGLGHGSDSSLDVRYKVGPMLRNEPYAVPKNDIWSKIYTRLPIPADLTEYNRFSIWVNLQGMRSTCVPIGVEVDYDDMLEYYDRTNHVGRRHYHAVTRMPITGGQWNKVWLDFSHMSIEFRKRIRYIILANFWHGVQPSDNHDEIHFLYDDARLEHVANPRKSFGWGADPAVVTVNQLGYKPLSEKVALLPASSAADTFIVRESGSHKVVFRGGFKPSRTAMGDFLEGEFTAVDSPGRYYVQAGSLRSHNFVIDDQPYSEVSAALQHIVAGMRSGTATHLHEASHLDAVWDPEIGKHIDLAGGHYDAGDLRLYSHSSMAVAQFAMDTRRLLPADDPLRPALLDEARWSFLMLEKSFKAFGYMAVVARMNGNRDGNWYTDNKIGTADDYVVNKARKGNFSSWFSPGLPRMAAAYRTKNPGLADRAMKIAHSIHDRFMKNDLRSNLALYETTGDEEFRRAAERQIPRLLSYQENRVLEKSVPPISGMIALNADRTSFNSYPQDIFYGRNIAALAEAMKVFPDHYYEIYFALRRYSDFFLKPVTRKIGPYGMPGDAAIESGRGKFIGFLDARPYFVDYEGPQTELAVRSAMPLVEIAAALADPEIEAIAQRCAGQMSGWNPYNFSFIHGFGEEHTSHVYALYPLTRGMMPRYLRLYNHSRTDAHEIWGRLQSAAAASFAALNAPCHVMGKITTNGAPYKGKVFIKTPSGRIEREFTPGADGSYGPLKLSGGGRYTLQAGEVSKSFVAIAAAHYSVSFDTATEIKIRGRRLTGKVSKLVFLSGKDVRSTGGKPGWYHVPDYDVELPFDGRQIQVKVNETYKVELEAIALGTGSSTHEMTIHAVNANVEPAKQAVKVTPGKPSQFSFDLKATSHSETICLLAEVDGDHLNKWELSAVALPNPAYLRATLTSKGKPVRGTYEILNEEDAVITKGRIYPIGTLGRGKPVILPDGGTFRVKVGQQVSSAFTIEPGKLAELKLSL